MKNSYRVILAAVAALGLGVSAQAQMKGDYVVEKKDSSPYAIDGRGVIWRSGTNLCWRTGTWSRDAAMNAKVVGQTLPAGCLCEPDQMPAGACLPPAPPPVVVAPPPPAPAPAPKPAPAPAPAPAAEKVTIPADALFAFDKAEITPAGKDKLIAFADSVKKLNIEVIIAVGHADRIGSDEYNQSLSEKRAAAVKDLLVGQGIEANRVYTEGKGETQPVTGDTCKKMGPESGKNKKLVDCLAPDRRVELEAVGTQTPAAQ